MTQHLTNAPAILGVAASQLDACAGWAGDQWYPRVIWANAALPLAVWEESEYAPVSYAAGCGALAAGTLKVTLHYAQTVDDGTVETAARTLLNQLLAQQSGVTFKGGDCSLSGAYTTAEAATDTATTAITLTLPYGLTA